MTNTVRPTDLLSMLGIYLDICYSMCSGLFFAVVREEELSTDTAGRVEEGGAYEE
jgi:hypothetical protein